ncbi:heme exporter protein CcmB [Legionella impletisoli]|uniref:Heme exporter protein B n=1 Tax=Legionella impletisoli TaxID=343510 RepID=A0A917N8Y0_9GAMM|nr:heme exporter protein CcmB [Legionella impletisoli]GGI78792.1 heme exporter protein B [Legionella impletisoli]
MNLTTLFFRQVKRESLVLIRQFRYVINSSLIFLMIMIFFPLTMPPDPELLRRMAPGLAWIALLMVMLISADRLFQQDYEDGIIEQWLVSGQPVSVLVLAKTLVHWVISLVPIMALTPFLSMLFGLNGYETITLMQSLACGSPAILFLCALAAVFSGGLKQQGVFMALILLPLTIPVMIFGSGAVAIAMQGMPVIGYLALLMAMSLMTIGCLPFAIAAMMRISLVD